MRNDHDLRRGALILIRYAIVAFLVSCRHFWSWGDYMAIHRDGIQKLSAARQMNAHYEKVDNFIVNFGSREQPMEWQTVAFIDGRFELTYVQPITVDYSKRTVAPAGAPKFYLNAADTVRLLPEGVPETTYEPRLRRVFGEAEWEKFVASNFDLTSLGIPQEEIHPIALWTKHVDGWRKDRVPIR